MLMTVKWFDPFKGYGLCRAAEVPGRDIFLHSYALRSRGFNRVVKGATLEGTVGETGKGPRVFDVVRVEASPEPAPAGEWRRGLVVKFFPGTNLAYMHVDGVPGDTLLYKTTAVRCGVLFAGHGHELEVIVRERHCGFYAEAVREIA